MISEEIKKLRRDKTYIIPEIDENFRKNLFNFVESGGLTKAIYNATMKVLRNSYHYDFLDKNTVVCCNVVSENTEWCNNHNNCTNCPLNTAVSAARARMEGKIDIYNGLEIITKHDIDLMKVNMK